MKITIQEGRQFRTDSTSGIELPTLLQEMPDLVVMEGVTEAVGSPGGANKRLDTLCGMCTVDFGADTPGDASTPLLAVRTFGRTFLRFLATFPNISVD